MGNPEGIQEIEDKIKELNEEKKKIQKQNKGELIEDRKLRLKSNNNEKSNILTRVSNNFARKLEFINDKREENGFDRLSNPKITELIVKHISSWRAIEEDIMLFNTGLELDSEEKQEVVIHEQ